MGLINNLKVNMMNLSPFADRVPHKPSILKTELLEYFDNEVTSDAS